MSRPAAIFWTLIALMSGASAWFVAATGAQRQALVQAQVSVQTGDLVTLGKIIDGDTVQVKRDGQDAGLIRILGIKAFSTRVEKDIAADFGRAAEEEVRRLTDNRPLRVLLHSTAKDRYGRTIATLYADEQDLGLELVRRGLALVFPVYPFPAITAYAHAQGQARAERRGLWAHPEASARADALIAEWRARAP